MKPVDAYELGVLLQQLLFAIRSPLYTRAE